MTKSTRVLVFTSCLLLTAILARATDLSGKVTVKGAPLAGAVVTANLIGASGPAAVSVTRTGSQGEYALRGLKAGNYILLVDMNARRIYQGKIALKSAALVKNVALK
jgi:hypothetical protein